MCFTGAPCGPIIYSEVDEGWHTHTVILFQPLGSNYLAWCQATILTDMVAQWQTKPILRTIYGRAEKRHGGSQSCRQDSSTSKQSKVVVLEWRHILGQYGKDGGENHAKPKRSTQTREWKQEKNKHKQAWGRMERGGLLDCPKEPQQMDVAWKSNKHSKEEGKAKMSGLQTPYKVGCVQLGRYEGVIGCLHILQTVCWSQQSTPSTNTHGECVP